MSETRVTICLLKDLHPAVARAEATLRRFFDVGPDEVSVVLSPTDWRAGISNTSVVVAAAEIGSAEETVLRRVAAADPWRDDPSVALRVVDHDDGQHVVVVVPGRRILRCYGADLDATLRLAVQVLVSSTHRWVARRFGRELDHLRVVTPVGEMSYEEWAPLAAANFVRAYLPDQDSVVRALARFGGVESVEDTGSAWG